MLQGRITKPLGNHFNWLIIYVPNRCTWPIWIQLHCVLLPPAQASPSLCSWGSHSSFCSGSTTEVTVKKEMSDSGCLSSRGLLDLRLSLIPDGYKELPREGTWIWPCSTPLVEALLWTMWEPGYRKNTGLQWRRNIVYLSGLFKKSVFRETKISIHQSGTQKASHNLEYENMSRAACKMDLHISELHIQHSAGHPELH